ncbi:cytochrome c oxidase subunit 4 [Pseudactinotalea suaedae]|uniref:cytochrome c oxidase subunit 4 n=1 Tax=Pseudactinotalea suaedae TaxID=1524924 RepID=UPI0012E3030C|nr:cytochrome c oxidase subunit 4 [Pseudactinotalea suaedae]
MSAKNKKQVEVQPLAPEWKFFILLAAFFALMTGLYAYWSWLYFGSVEPIGTTALTLLVGLCVLSGGYLFKLSREIEVRPEDDPHAEQHVAAGEYGHFSPWSWWPLICGVAVALIFLGPALMQWWIAGIGVVVGVIGVAGHVLEYNRGPHAH